MEQDKRAWFDIPITLKFEESYSEDEISFRLEDNYIEYSDNLTDKQKKDLGKQIIDLVTKHKFTIRSSIDCPNCESQADVTDNEHKYECHSCGLKMTLEPKKK